MGSADWLDAATLQRAIMEVLATVCVLRGPKHEFAFANAAYHALVGERVLEGRPLSEAVPELAGHGFFELLDRVYRTGEPYHGFEVPIPVRGPDGTLEQRFYTFVYHPLIESDGKTSGILAFGFDVTEPVLGRKHAEERTLQGKQLIEKLKLAMAERDETEERFRLMVDSVKDSAIFMLDRDGKVSTWNSGAERLNGYRADEIVGKSFALFYPEDVAAAGHPEHQLQHAGDTGRYAEEGWRVRKDGSQFWADVVITALKDEHGRVRGFATVIRDLTQPRLAQAEREQLIGQLRAAVRARDEFLEISSHELNTPVAALTLNLALLKRAVPAALSEAHDALSKATRQTARLARLIGSLLDVARITRGLIVLEPADFDLADLIDELAKRLEEDATRSGSPIVVHGCKQLTVRWDRLRVEQILSSLLANALKYGAGKPIKVAFRREQDWVEVSVMDHGMGLNQLDRERVFAKFEQAVSARHFGGLGLGLFIAQQFAQAHGGTLTVESEVGLGATFRLRLPWAAQRPAY